MTDGQKWRGHKKDQKKKKTGLPWSGKQVWKMKIFPGQGKVREFWFESGKLENTVKSGNFKIF